MFKNIFNFVVYLCCGDRKQPAASSLAGMQQEQTYKNLISEEYDELVEYLKKQSKRYKKPSICC